MDALISEAPSTQVQAWFKYLPPTHIVKRDGRTVAFHPRRIRAALLHAGRSTGEFDESEAELLEHRVMKVLRHRFSGLTPNVEQVQDIVEQTLVDADYLRTFRAYVAYRAQHQRLRDDRHTLIDVVASIDKYLDRADWRIGTNAREGHSLGALILDVSGKVVGNYWLSHVYSPEIGQAHRDAELYLHNLDGLSGDRSAWSLRQLLHEGLGRIDGAPESAPPRHFSSALGQLVDFVGALRNEWAGTQTLCAFDTRLAAFVRADSLGYPAVRQAMQEFIHRLGTPPREGRRPADILLAFDRLCPDALRAQTPMIGGQPMPYAYGELQAEMALINRAYVDVTSSGDTSVPHDPGRRCNARFAPPEQCGSIGVVTINCARLAHVYRGAEPALMARLDRLAEMARDSLEIKRKLLQHLIDDGRFPQTRRYLGTLRGHCSTIGVEALDEMASNFGDAPNENANGHDLARRALDRLRDRVHDFQRETGNLYTLEATTRDGTSCRFAREGRQRIPDTRQAGTARQAH